MFGGVKGIINHYFNWQDLELARNAADVTYRDWVLRQRSM
jgi:hypothetical protein